MPSWSAFNSLTGYRRTCHRKNVGFLQRLTQYPVVYVKQQLNQVDQSHLSATCAERVCIIILCCL